MTAHLSNGSAAANGDSSASSGHSIKDLPKSNNFTSHLLPDPAFPTPSDSHKAPREKLGPRLVKGALYTYVRPEPTQEPELLAVSPCALEDLNIASQETEGEDFRETVAGNKIIAWDENTGEGIYPWAQCYGGYQFGQWAGQLGDGRAISLFEIPNQETKIRYELQLKGAGRTPYSRFADGKAVLRSSIREFIVSEALNALKIPTTRALSLTLAPHARVRRERTEPGAIVARFAQSWLRIGTFDLLRARGDRALIRQLSTYVAEEVFPGWESLPALLPDGEPKDTAISVQRGITSQEIQGEAENQENRFTRLYREIVRRNAKMVASWQAYAFTNGVLNTDNTSIFGLSIDFGPFAFLDNFDPNYTPNHDDHSQRYSYRNQPSIIWWNLVRLGEAMGEPMGAGARCDETEFVEEGVRKDWVDELVARAENLIQKIGEEYKAVFLAEYTRLMTARLGLKETKDGDFDTLFSGLLDSLEALELDFNHTFRKLCNIKMADLETEEQRKDVAGRFFHHEGLTGLAGSEDDARKRIANWLDKWRARVREDWGDEATADGERAAAMKKVNPKFTPRSWILDELITRVEQQGERDVLQRVLHMALNPFEDSWGGDAAEEERFCGDVPRGNRAMQCSCSS
ncbi:hypothetical protein BJ546DRAFT_1066154 [Cryomyces antarcticus]